MAKSPRRWSADVTKHSDAPDIKKNTFAQGNRAGKNLSEKQLDILEKAKDELRKLYSKTAS